LGRPNLLMGLPKVEMGKTLLRAKGSVMSRTSFQGGGKIKTHSRGKRSYERTGWGGGTALSNQFRGNQSKTGLRGGKDNREEAGKNHEYERVGFPV